MTHGEQWLIKKRNFSVKNDSENEIDKFFKHIKRRDPKKNKIYYILKLRAVWGLLGLYRTEEENFAAVEVYKVYCKKNRYKIML